MHSSSARTPETLQLLSAVEQAAARLNVAADDLSAAYEWIQKRLVDCGIGVEAWVSIETTRIWDQERSEALQCRVWDEEQLGYARLGDAWALLTRAAHFDDSEKDGHWEYGERKPLVRSSRRTRVEAVQALPSLLSALQSEADRVLALVEDAKHLAYGRSMSKDCMWCEVERTSVRRLHLGQPRECPACDHVFQGNGWDGIDAHWKAQHARQMGVPYERFWHGIMSCVRHWGV